MLGLGVDDVSGGGMEDVQNISQASDAYSHQAQRLTL